MALSRNLVRCARLEMDLSQAGLPHVPMLGRYHYSFARPALREHAHRDALEVCYLVKGRQTYRVGGCDYHLRGGDVFVTFPNERHSTGDAPEEKGLLYWLVRQAPARSNGKQKDALWESLRRLPHRHFAGSPRMKECLDTATAIFHQGGPLRGVTLDHLVIGFLLEVVRCGTTTPPVRRRSLDKVLRYIAGHLDEPVSVPRLAGLARLSESHFKARFKDELGLPPAEYQLRARIAEARRRLVSGKRNVTEVAFDLGFSSSQYFATVFRRFTRMSPRDCLPRTRSGG